MKFLYTVSIHLLVLSIRLASLFNKKATLAIRGRKNWKQRLINTFKENHQPVIWFHISSLGEFEQAKPLIVRIKTTYPHYKLLVTFFSPSGYEARKNFEYADAVFYLPYDTSANAQEFLDIVRPQYIFFVKYEFWLNFLYEIINRKQKDQLSCFLISSIFRPHQPFFKWYGHLFRNALKAFDIIFVQDTLSARLLKKIGITQNVCLSGDTRIDRVLEIAQYPVAFPEIETFCYHRKTIMAGSTWHSDDAVLIPTLKKLKQQLPHHRLCFIIAPHQPDLRNVQKLIRQLERHNLSHCKYTELTNLSSERLKTYDVLLIDTIGVLNKIYRYGLVAYIGGGFADGIHNILEPAVYGLPVVFGPKYQKFYEATELIRTKGAVSIKNESELYTVLNEWLTNSDKYQSAVNATKQFIDTHKGAVDKTMSILNQYL